MTPRIESMRSYLLNKEHHKFRRSVDWGGLTKSFEETQCSPMERVSLALEAMLKAEAPCFLPGERIAYLRTVREIPELYTAEEWKKLHAEYALAEKGVLFNLCPDYSQVLASGLDAVLHQLELRLAAARGEGDDEGEAFLCAAIRSLKAVLELADRYLQAAEEHGMKETTEVLRRVPHYGAESFLEALQMIRILHFTLWCEGEYHNGLGRIDQYLWPYLKRDLDCGRLNPDTALELLEEFFLTFNRDSDLYIGIQQGDNGQSLVVGGIGEDGNEIRNLLTELTLRASCNLAVVDPKINLRITGRTPIELLVQASELTRAGLGFPQYSNDDVVIPALEACGYAPEDARNYVVAACWEFTIPGLGVDVPNIDAVSLPHVIDTVLRTPDVPDTFPAFLEAVRSEIFRRADAIENKLRSFTILPGPFISLLYPGTVERARDISGGVKYNNFGVHSTGLSCAADSLAAIREVIYTKRLATAGELVRALDNDYADTPELLAAVRNAPKMGCDDDCADEFATILLDMVADAWEGRRNNRGGIFRGGTGSAMYYIRHADELPASPDGRRKGMPFSANYAPSLGVRVPSPTAVVRSFTKPNLNRVCNGGPLTIELHASVFSEPESLEQIAYMLRDFCQRGGHQLQLNSINSETLLHAQAHPEEHRQLIVRVWGWSGYFIELDKVYQDQIIRRAEMKFAE